MLGLRYFACGDCGTVSALPAPPDRCGDCAGGDLRELTGRLDAADARYFAGES